MEKNNEYTNYINYINNKDVIFKILNNPKTKYHILKSDDDYVIDLEEKNTLSEINNEIIKDKTKMIQTIIYGVKIYEKMDT